MDLKNFILFFVLILTFRQTHGYITCMGMSTDTETFGEPLCTLLYINENYLLENQFYNADSVKNITQLSIRANLSDIPDGIRIRFGAIQTLDFFHTGLENLSKKSFERVPSTVEFLTVGFSRFKTLFSEMFSSIAKLQELSLLKGAIEHIHDTAFAGLVDLKKLDLSRNRIKTLTKAMFDELPNLSDLKLLGNLLSGTLESGLFAGCPHLTSLNFADNQITTVMDGFVSTKYIHNLFLPRNRLTSFNLSSVQVSSLFLDNNNLTELMINSAGQKLYASHNNISKLICSNDSNLTLVELNLAYNSISSMECIEKAPSLEHLELNYNNIGKLNINSFANLTELKSLLLRNSNISNLVPGVLSHQSKLTLLDVSYNQLGNISIDVFSAAINLTTLRIEGNNLTNISYWNIDELFPSLEAFGIGDNNFSCPQLSAIFMYFNRFEHYNVIIPPPDSEKVIDSPNIKGIKCTLTNSTPILPEDFDLDSFYELMKGIEYRSFVLELIVNDHIINYTWNEIEAAKSEMNVLSSREHLHFVILCVMMSIIGAIVVGSLGYYGYNKWKDVPSNQQSNYKQMGHRPSQESN